MPLFLSDEELESLRHDPLAVAEKADAYIRDLYAQLDTVKAQADAASITAEQTCSQLEHTHLSLSADYSDLQSRHSHLENNLQQRLSELAQVQSDKHQLHLKSIEKDGEVERMSTEIAELHKSKRQLIAMLEQKDAEINEKNSTIQSYLDKIVNLTEKAAEREARLRDVEAELVRSQATCERLLLEKELIERHNVWLNEELTDKTDSLMEFRKKHVELEADMSAKLRDVEKQYEESSNSLKWYKERVSELEMKLTSLQEDLCKTKDSAASTEEQYVAEITTVSKLVELYKESSDEWSKKAGELEGVIKALETHLSQLQNEHKEKTEKEEALRREAEKEAAELREKLIKCEAEIESNRKARELSILPLSNFSKEGWVESFESNDNAADNLILGPSIPAGVSGTALATSLLRDGWSLAKMYAKYQEAVDTLRHEQLGRKQSQAVLERVLLEIEEKASVILDERAEHERMAEAYALMNEKLHQSLAEQAKLEKVIQQLKADLRRRERDYNSTQTEIADLQKQVTVLLKECRDIQLRCGSAANGGAEIEVASLLMDINAVGDAEKVIADHMITFMDINGLVEQNVKLRCLVRSLSNEIENKENELKEQFEVELQKHDEEATAKVASVLERAEQQGCMIDSLHSSVAMYKRLYEEEHKLRSSDPHVTSPPSGDGRKEQALLFESSQNSAKQVQEQFVERVRCLEEELTTLRSGIISLRAERDKFVLESNFAREKLERYVKDMDHQREEMNGILTRNVEFQRLIVDYQKQLRESAQSLLAAEEHSRKLTMEISVVKREKELLHSSERRICDEVRDLSERVHRLQATLDTIHISEHVREEARAVEMKKLEEHTKHIEKEWAEAKKELQIERDNARVLSLDRDNSMKEAMRQIEQMGKELASALQATTAAETKAVTFKARCSDLEWKLKTSNIKANEKDGATEGLPSSNAEIMRDLYLAKEEIERLKLEAQANKDHMLQYKSIAEVNEIALKQMESSFELFKSEAEKGKIFLEEEISSLRGQVSQLESESSLRSVEAVSATTDRETALVSSHKEIANLRDEISGKVSQAALMEVQISSLRADLEKEHQKWRAAHENYERQVILQAETIQELTKASEALALLQEESSKLKRLADEYKSENEELRAKWEKEKSEVEKFNTEAEKKYNELNEQNKILHTRLEAMRIKVAELDCQKAGITAPSASMESDNDSGLESVVSYLRRSKEIAETEISLLKQEKLRLQSQLERALKEAEAAQAVLGEEQANARTVFTEEDFKSLQLQVREMNLLRESNMQLRQENKYNLEECKKLREVGQKAKDEAENLKNLLREREMETDALRKKIDLGKEEQENYQKKLSEDYIRIKSDFQQMQVNMKEKEREIEKTRSLLSEKEEIISKLEHDLAGTKSELMEKESHVLQNEANLKADLEKQKKLVLQLRRRIDIVSKEKDSLSKEKEMLLKEKTLLTRDKESLLVEKELLTKEEEEKSKEIQGLMKQLEGSRQESKGTGDVEYQTLVNEKDKRIQTLEKVIEREREEKKKEKERRMLTEKAITAKVTSVDQERKKFEDEQEKHKEAVKRISVELEKLKHAKDSLPEGTSVVQLLSGSVLDDLASSYVLAIQSFERLAHTVLLELGAQSATCTSVPDSLALTGTGPVASVPVAASSSMASPARAPSRIVDDREKKTTVHKTNVETRKIVRKLVRPRLVKQEEPQGDSEMEEMEGSSKSAPANDVETQTGPCVAAEPQVRKRVAVSSVSELHAESLLQDVKRSKGTETSEKDDEGHSSMENAETPAASQVHDAPANILAQDINDVRKDDVESSQGQPEGSKEQQHSDDTHMQHDDTVTLTENVDNVNEGAASEEVLKVQFESEPQHTIGDIGEHEEGEVSEFLCGADTFNTTENDDATDLQPETCVVATEGSPLRIEDEQSVAITEVVSKMNPEDLSVEKLEEGEVSDAAAEKSNDQVGGEAEQSSEIAAATEVSNAEKEGSSAVASPTAASATTINLNARARERAAQRLGTLSPPVRGRGRPAARGRGRGVRRGGRQASGDQG